MAHRLWMLCLLTACGAKLPPATEQEAAVPPAAVATSPIVDAATTIADPGPTAMVAVPGGIYEPLFPGRDGKKQQPVAAFRLERHPVSNAQFRAFVAAEPKWRRSRVSRLFADAGYLAAWRSDLDPGDLAVDSPVTEVSWFAARAYARWRSRRLPSLAEWESAAALPLADGSDATRAILAWYSKPAQGQHGRIGSGSANVLGITDLHGLVWEWVEDFSGAMVTGDARGDTDLMRSLFCGAGAVGSARPSDYAAFMRQAMRSSLQGSSSTSSLGFRCAGAAVDDK